MSLLRSALLLAFMLPLVAACGRPQSADSPNWSRPAEGPYAPQAAATMADLEGTWAGYFESTQLVSSDVTDDMAVTLQLWSRLVVTQGPDGHEVEFKVCDVAPFDMDWMSVLWPAATVAAIQTQRADLDLADSPAGAQLTGSITLVAGWIPETMMPEEAVPVAADDPRVDDRDQDGNPGVTLRIDSIIDGDLYGAARTSAQITGALESADRIRGASDVRLELVTLGANPSLFAMDVTAVQDPSGPNEFRFVRMPDGGACDDIPSDSPF